MGAVDVGSPQKMGWAIVDRQSHHSGHNLDEFIDLFSTKIEGRPTALGFEAPLFIPCHQELRSITARRIGEKDRPWSAGAGATVTTIGLAVMAYTLRNLKQRVAPRRATLDWRKWPQRDDLLIFEAFVSGQNHAGPG